MDLGDVRVSTDANENAGQGKNALIPDIYTENPVAEPISIEFVSRTTDDDDESVGFDPYDTATLYKIKW